MIKQPNINVGILAKHSVPFRFNGKYKLQESGQRYNGEFEATHTDKGILFDNQLFPSLTFIPENYPVDSFVINDVVIGINFHWERTETQCFQGTLRVIQSGNSLVAINSLLLEDYLLSVISSEMNATSSIELLKAHAVISRSWLLAQLKKKENISQTDKEYQSAIITDNEIVRWYDREEHHLFDVCADDHCQRYQGITKASTPAVQEAITATYGEVLMSDNAICDARFSKCCGGLSEEFENCWEPVPHSYLKSVVCGDQLLSVMNWEDWIMSNPPAFCNTQNKKTLSQVLNNYDQETNDFFRWNVIYSQVDISALISAKLNIDFGEIIDLIPEVRGKSGRIIRLHIVGTKKQMYIGKELEIRKSLSKTHLYSSAFIVHKENIVDGIPQQFTLHGAGWGHGVGLCQIGAAVMAEKGFDYQSILKHYFKGAELEREY